MYTLLNLTGNSRVSEGIADIRPMNEAEFNEVLLRQRDAYKKMQDKWEADGILAIVMPVFFTVAFKAKNDGDMGAFMDYVALWSILHYPQGVIPVTEV